MSVLRFVLEKEFRQIFRNPAILRMILIMPIIQLILLPFAADYEVKKINLVVIDHDHSTTSRELTEKLRSSGYFKLIEYTADFNEAFHAIENNDADVLLEIPANFDNKLIKENESQLSISANTINGIKGNLGTAYIAQVILSYNEELREKKLPLPKIKPVSEIEVLSLLWYNPHTNYKLFMVPGILAVLLTMVGSFLAAMNIVYEKETGTIDQINVTPIRKSEFLLGKLIPFWVLGIISLTMGLIVSYVIYGIIPLGHYHTIYIFAIFYLISILGLGLLVSTFAQTQQQATFISFFMMSMFILMSGLYTSVDSMPDWARIIAECNPVTHIIRVLRAVILKGSNLYDLRMEFSYIVIFAIGFNVLAIMRYRKVNN